MSSITTLISKNQLDMRIAEIAEELNRLYKGNRITFLVTLKGSVPFSSDLAKLLDTEMEFYYLDVSSYGDKTESSGRITDRCDISIFHDPDFCERNILLIEDIIDTGRTIHYLINKIKSFNPGDFKVVTLLDKPDRRLEEFSDVKPDFTGFIIPDKFVVGYGLDYAQLYRNLPFIGVLDLDS